MDKILGQVNGLQEAWPYREHAPILSARNAVLRNSRSAFRPMLDRRLSRKTKAAIVEEPQLSEGETVMIVTVDPRTLISSTIPWRSDTSIGRVDAPSNAPPLVILPGFGNCARDYEEPFGPAEDSVAAALRRRGFRVYTVQIERRDWFKVGRSLLSRSYWSGTCTVDPGYRWYLERVQQAVDRARSECKQDQVHLVGHSAGGWLGRSFIADPLYFDSPAAEPGVPHQGVASLVTLGTPHSAPLPDQARDMTGGALTWVNSQWPGAHFEGRGVRYMCVAGAAVRGDRGAPRRSVQRYAHSAYSQVCGDGHGQVGDVVVPMTSALLPGAEHIGLDGVFHSMSKGSRDWPIEHRWYGSEDVIDHWAHFLVSERQPST